MGLCNGTLSLLYHMGQVLSQMLDTQRALECCDIERAPQHKRGLAWRPSLGQHCVANEAPASRSRQRNEHRRRPPRPER
jgi:hypothetical protein